MKTTQKLLVLIISASFICTCTPKKETSWESLFNGKDLSGWDTWLGPKFDTLINKFDSFHSEGLNNDADHVFTVVEEDGMPAIRISGQTHGGISTIKEFTNYHLILEFKWGKLKWHPRKDRKRDSGLLYHGVGAQGAAYGNWLLSQECQIQEGDVGDYWSVAGSIMDVNSSQRNDTIYYDPKGPIHTFSYTSKDGKRCYKNPDAEKPSGEWNTVEIYCLGDSSIHVINGVLNMVLLHSRMPAGENEIPLVSGKVQLQSEGAEVFYRNIRLQLISEIPAEILKY